MFETLKEEMRNSLKEMEGKTERKNWKTSTNHLKKKKRNQP